MPNLFEHLIMSKKFTLKVPYSIFFYKQHSVSSPASLAQVFRFHLSVFTFPSSVCFLETQFLYA